MRLTIARPIRPQADGKHLEREPARHRVLARYGGEEFALAMPGTTLEEAEALLTRLCEALPDGQTCSAGVCVWNGKESAEALIDRADAALYSAKEAGRDRVVAAQHRSATGA
jgi:diguanylate cyclase (GGDEF)-like protein